MLKKTLYLLLSLTSFSFVISDEFKLLDVDDNEQNYAYDDCPCPEGKWCIFIRKDSSSTTYYKYIENGVEKNYIIKEQKFETYYQKCSDENNLSPIFDTTYNAPKKKQTQIDSTTPKDTLRHSSCVFRLKVFLQVDFSKLSQNCELIKKPKGRKNLPYDAICNNYKCERDPFNNPEEKGCYKDTVILKNKTSNKETICPYEFCITRQEYMNYINDIKKSGLNKENGKRALKINNLESNKTNYFYPNPANEFCYIIVNNEKITNLKIIDYNGKIFHLNKNEFDQNTINLSNFKSGLYIVIIQLENGEKLRQKLMVIH